MIAAGNTYHCVGPLNARRLLTCAVTLSGRQPQRDLQTNFASTTIFASKALAA